MDRELTTRSSYWNDDLKGLTVAVRTKSRQLSLASWQRGQRRIEHTLSGMSRTYTPARYYVPLRTMPRYSAKMMKKTEFIRRTAVGSICLSQTLRACFKTFSRVPTVPGHEQAHPPAADEHRLCALHTRAAASSDNGKAILGSDSREAFSRSVEVKVTRRKHSIKQYNQCRRSGMGLQRR